MSQSIQNSKLNPFYLATSEKLAAQARQVGGYTVSEKIPTKNVKTGLRIFKTRFWAPEFFSYDIWSVRLCYFLFETKILRFPL